MAELPIPYGRQTITESDIRAVERVLRSPYLTQGPAVSAFEQAVVEKVGAAHGVAVNSATSALHIACLALGLGPDDRLWTTPITFVASANCGRYCGASIDFVDIDPATGLMNVGELEKKLGKAEKNRTLPKVVIPVHLAGSSCDMATIWKLAKRYGFRVIEDASHAIGGHYQGKAIGNCHFSDITVFSFHPVKIITSGEGGLATTNSTELARRMMELRSHGITKDVERFEQPSPGPWFYEQQSMGFNYRLTDIQAALGLNQLQRLEQVVKERNRLFKAYQEQLQSLPASLLQIPHNAVSACHLAIVRLDEKDPDLHRRVFEGLRTMEIGVQVHYSPVHLQPYYRRLGFSEGDFPEAENYATNAISLPIYPGLDDQDQQRVVQALSYLLSK